MTWFFTMQFIGRIPINHQGLCPNEWHIPRNQELLILTNYSSLALRSSWDNGTNSTGFSAVKSGMYFAGFSNSGMSFWSSSEPYSYMAKVFSVLNGATRIDEFYKNRAISVRCIKD